MDRRSFLRLTVAACVAPALPMPVADRQACTVYASAGKSAHNVWSSAIFDGCLANARLVPLMGITNDAIIRLK